MQWAVSSEQCSVGSVQWAVFSGQWGLLRQSIRDALVLKREGVKREDVKREDVKREADRRRETEDGKTRFGAGCHFWNEGPLPTSPASGGGAFTQIYPPTEQKLPPACGGTEGGRAAIKNKVFLSAFAPLRETGFSIFSICENPFFPPFLRSISFASFFLSAFASLREANAPLREIRFYLRKSAFSAFSACCFTFGAESVTRRGHRGWGCGR